MDMHERVAKSPMAQPRDSRVNRINSPLIADSCASMVMMAGSGSQQEGKGHLTSNNSPLMDAPF